MQVIAASGAVKHEDIVEQVKTLFTKLSTDSTTTSQLAAKEPAVFTGSEVSFICCSVQVHGPNIELNSRDLLVRSCRIFFTNY